MSRCTRACTHCFQPVTNVGQLAHTQSQVIYQHVCVHLTPGMQQTVKGKADKGGCNRVVDLSKSSPTQQRCQHGLKTVYSSNFTQAHDACMVKAKVGTLLIAFLFFYFVYFFQLIVTFVTFCEVYKIYKIYIYPPIFIKYRWIHSEVLNKLPNCFEVNNFIEVK